MISSYSFPQNSQIYSAVSIVQTAGKAGAALLTLQVFMALHQLPVVKQKRQRFGILAPMTALGGIKIIAIQVGGFAFYCEMSAVALCAD
jgi:hypothetical protein